MRVVIAPDGFGGVLSAAEVAAALADGWRRERPDDEQVLRPLSDGGEGLLAVLADADDHHVAVEVAGPHGHPVEAELLMRADGTAVIESALACGLALVAPERRSPMPATTYGVGQLLDAARRAGAQRVVVGLGGSSTVDGGAGALSGLGFRLRVGDGSGLKIGAADLPRVRWAERGWSADWHDIDVELLVDTDATLAESAPLYGPQKGATPAQVDTLTGALETWAEVAERDLAGGRRVRGLPGSGAAGGLGFGLAAGLGASLVPGAARVAELVGLEAAIAGADLVVTGEGRLDATSLRGKLVAHVLEIGRTHRRPVQAVVGVAQDGADHALAAVEQASPAGVGADPVADVTEAAGRLASSVVPP